MKHRCDEFNKQGVRCPGRHPWEEDDEDDCEEDDTCGDFYLVLPERNRAALAGELFGFGALAAEMFLLDFGDWVGDGLELPEAAVDYGSAPGDFLPNPLGDRHLELPTGPPIRAGQAEPTVLVRGTYYTADNGYAAELFGIAAAAILVLSIPYLFTNNAFQNLASYTMSRFLARPSHPAGGGLFFQAPDYVEGGPGKLYDTATSTYTVGDQPAMWYGGETQYTP